MKTKLFTLFVLKLFGFNTPYSIAETRRAAFSVPLTEIDYASSQLRNDLAKSSLNEYLKTGML